MRDKKRLYDLLAGLGLAAVLGLLGWWLTSAADGGSRRVAEVSPPATPSAVSVTAPPSPEATGETPRETAPTQTPAEGVAVPSAEASAPGVQAPVSAPVADPAPPEARDVPSAPPAPQHSDEAAPALPPAQMTAGGDYDFSQPVPETEPVEDSYFADAVFIGDSRTDGFRLYSGLSRGDYIVKTGLSVFQAETEKVKVGGKKMTVPQALERGEYGKVYICLGLNELGMQDDQGYYDHYAAFIDRIRALQPHATVYIQLIIPVNAQKCAEKKMAGYINNDQIDVYNGLLRQLAREKRVFLVDPAQAIVDETGQPPYDQVADGVHFQKEPYQQWLDYLRRHTVEKGEWE